jgi:hypothetical protein
MSKVSSRLREVINLKPFSMVKGNFLFTSGINGLIFNYKSIKYARKI